MGMRDVVSEEEEEKRGEEEKRRVEHKILQNPTQRCGE